MLRICYDVFMSKMTKAEAGKKGSIIRWSRIAKKKRSAIMKKVAQARWNKII